MRKLFTLLVIVVSACAAFAATDLSRKYDDNISITPTTCSMPREGGTAAINTSGSGTSPIWYASSSANWISVKTISGIPPSAVGYTVAENEGVETRVGYIYVSGHKYTITQAGVGAALEEYSAEFETAGGKGTITVAANDGNDWTAHANVDWLTLAATSGTGNSSVSYTVKAYDKVSTRSGTITIAGNTFTVYQTGRRMLLTSYNTTVDYLAETVKIRVNALASTTWSVSSSADWVTISDAGNGKGGDVVLVDVAENPAASARTATVTIGTEQFTISQLKRTDLIFKISPSELATDANGVSSSRISVSATPALAWSAKSDSDWITFFSGYSSGSGSGSVSFKVAANPTLYSRSGIITVSPNDKNSGVADKKFEITQEASVASLSVESYEFEAKGGSFDVGVNVPNIVGWNVINQNDWLTISGASMVGPATLTLTASANTTVSSRSGTLTIADHVFTVSQPGRGVKVDYTTKVFDTDGKTTGKDSENVVTVTADSDVSWTAQASDSTWIIIYEGKSGKGSGTVKYIVAPYVGSGEVRTGTITIGDQVVYITQRPYEMMIDPVGETVDGNAGAGEIQVALDIDGVWNAIATEPWITVVNGYNSGTGSGKVMFRYTDNNTGKERTGLIVIAGMEYTLTQAARQNIAISTEVSGHGGKIDGGGTYNLGSKVTLSAVPDAGYVFDHWVLPSGGQSTEPSMTVTVKKAETYQAVFSPVKPTISVAAASLQGVRLVWTNVAWAAKYYVLRNVDLNPSQATKIATIENNADCTYLDETGALNQSYWYWIEAVGAEDDVTSDSVSAMRAKQIYSIRYANLRGTTHSNPATYLEGSSITFTAPSGRKGYTFEGWMPTAIAASTTGDLTVRAKWIQNEFSVRFDPNGGESSMSDENYTYGFWQYLNATNVTRNGYSFAGWSSMQNGKVEYADKQSLKNMTTKLNDVVTLYAVWTALVGIEGDASAVVTGNDSDGYVVKPSDGKTELTVRVPDGFDVKKITVEVTPDVQTIVANGATLKVVKGAHDITSYLNIPTPDGNGRINMSLAEVKPEVVKEAMDPEKGATFKLEATAPTLTTSATKPGLTYTLREGTTLKSMSDGATTVGDGKAWTPTLTIKGGTSGFYSIKVSK